MPQKLVRINPLVSQRRCEMSLCIFTAGEKTAAGMYYGSYLDPSFILLDLPLEFYLRKLKVVTYNLSYLSVLLRAQ